VSHEAIAAALARDDVRGGERLVAFSLASFAGRDGRAWPGAPAAAARAGLSRSRYLHDRDRLVRRGLVEIVEKASGRGRSSTVALRFATEGPWWEGEINAQLFEAALSRTCTRGPARLLLTAMAALADVDGVLRGLSNEELCAAAGLDDRTYRRARAELVASGELVLLTGARGRGNTNVWQVRPAKVPEQRPSAPTRRMAPPPGARPLLAAVVDGAGADELVVQADRAAGPRAPVAGENGRVSPGISPRKCGQDGTVSPPNCPAPPVVLPENSGQDRTLFELPAPEKPGENPAENPAANARGGTEAQNPRIEDPPNPPEGGSRARSMTVEQIYVTERGRRRRRMVRVNLDEVRRALGRPTAADRADWQRIRKLLEPAVGESTFAIWLDPLELIAIDGERRLVVAAPGPAAPWTRTRFGRLLASFATQLGRELRFASEPEIHALGRDERQVQQPRQEVAG
jgi:hypothetical protein